MHKEIILNWFNANFEQLKETSIFVITVIMGFFVKILKHKNLGNQLTASYIIAELIMSLLVGFTVYAVFDQFFNCNTFLVCVISAWCSSFSSMFHDKVKELIELSFEFIKKIFQVTPKI